MMPGFKPASRRSDLLLIASTTAVFLIVSLIASLEKALAFAVTFSVFLSIVQTRKTSELTPRFWIAFGALAVIHIAILSFVRMPELRFGLVVMPFALADGFLMWWLLNRLDRRSAEKRPNRRR